MCSGLINTFLLANWLNKKPRKAYFRTQLFNILLHLVSIFPKAEFSINRGLATTLYHGIIRWTKEICSRKSFHLQIRHNSMLNTLVHIVTPCLDKEKKQYIMRKSRLCYLLLHKQKNRLLLYILSTYQFNILNYRLFSGKKNTFLTILF